MTGCSIPEVLLLLRCLEEFAMVPLLCEAHGNVNIVAIQFACALTLPGVPVVHANQSISGPAELRWFAIGAEGHLEANLCWRF